ncbi:winged helix-turn-helix domain-containing protein [Histidinibacterium aquaticum]|uniref:winged helix-turn-helix domain-containing protein n=1 Tax=Histidinibacterium aquaticum TaxID=2613962 RepID=UPI0037C102E6
MKPVLGNAAARAHFLDRHLLLGPPSGPGRGEPLAEVIRALGFVQVDSVNTVARAHDLILWSRRQQYRPEALLKLLRQRAVFEHWTHDASVVPIQFYPHWRLKFARDRAHMDRRWPKWRREGYAHRFDAVLDQIAAHGPVTSADVGEGEERGGAGWWNWHPSKTALEYLWRSGELAVADRVGFRKVYDLTERVIPEQVLAWHPTEEESVDWAMSAALERLGFGTSGELRAFFDIVTPEEAKRWCAGALAQGRVEEVEIELADGTRRRCYAVPGLADAPAPAAGQRVRILSPFDPALRDRARAERLFGFSYRIEIVVPEPKRRYGYYVFPVLEGLRPVGRIDMKRDGEILAVRAYWPERGGSLGVGREARLVSELERVARLAGCARVDFAEGWRR